MHSLSLIFAGEDQTKFCLICKCAFTNSCLWNAQNWETWWDFFTSRDDEEVNFTHKLVFSLNNRLFIQLCDHDQWPLGCYSRKSFMNIADPSDIWRSLRIINEIISLRVAEVAREHGWHPLKSLDSDEIFMPEHALFCRELGFVAIYALFLEIFAQKSAFLGQKQCFLGKNALLHGMYCIFYWVTFANLQFTAKNTHLPRKK